MPHMQQSFDVNIANESTCIGVCRVTESIQWMRVTHSNQTSVAGPWQLVGC